MIIFIITLYNKIKGSNSLISQNYKGADFMILKVAERIHELRDKHDMTQAALARKMSVTRSSVNAWEMGISVPSTDKLVELAEIFHTSTDYLLGLSDSEYVDLERYDTQEKEIIYRLLHYFDNIHSR